MLDKSCIDFIDLLASKAPVPGGGGACAIVCSIGTALGSMVGNLTVGKKKYADVEDKMNKLLEKSQLLIENLNKLVLEDAEVFEPLSKAYGLPSETEEQKIHKEKMLQENLVMAAMVPLKIAEGSMEALKLLDEYAHFGSRLVVSDAGTGAAFCRAALQGAKLNVMINLKLMKDEQLKKDISDKLNKIEEQGLKLADDIYSYVEGELCY